MIELKKQVIEYAQKLNSTNLSPLRSGNVSDVRFWAKTHAETDFSKLYSLKFVLRK